MKTSDLVGPALDYAVALARGLKLVKDPFGSDCDPGWWVWLNPGYQRVGGGYSPSTNREQGFLIVEEHGIMFYGIPTGICAYLRSEGTEGPDGDGPTHLIAAMRCHLASELGGDEVDIPEDLK